MPGWLFDRVKFAIPSWEYRAKYTVNEKWGPVFVVVTPGTNVLIVADPDVAKKILVKRNEFGPIEIACSETIAPRRKTISVLMPIGSNDGNVWWKRRLGMRPSASQSPIE